MSSFLGELFGWYARQMRDLMPAALRADPDGGADALVIDAQAPDHGFTLRTRKRGSGTLGNFRLDEAAAARAAAGRRRRTVLLQLPPDRLLEREIVLPLAAEPELDRVVGYEMDRVTPFTAEEVFWHAAVLRRNKARAQMGVRLSFVPKAGIAPLLDALAGAGLAPTALRIGQGDAQRHIPLRHEGPRRGRIVSRALGVLAVLLLIAVLATPFVRTEIAIGHADARIAALRPTVNEAEGLRKRIAANTTGADAVAAEAARLGDPLQALAALTEILPDDTYLTEATLRQRHIVIGGQSGAAARLIGLLSADPVIRNPAFTAPVTRNETGKADLFVIRAEFGP